MDPNFLDEDPDPSDIDSADDDGTEPCPYCHKPIYEDSEWCPRCGEYLVKKPGSAAGRTAAWVIGTTVVLLAAWLLALTMGWHLW